MTDFETTNDRSAIVRGEECPDCGCKDTESNGEMSWRNREYRCVKCDWRWGHECSSPYGF